MIEESTYYGYKGRELFYRVAAPAAPEALLIVIHGYGEHSGRYEDLIQDFSSRGYAVFVPDLRGHGRQSAGLRGYRGTRQGAGGYPYSDPAGGATIPRCSAGAGRPQHGRHVRPLPVACLPGRLCGRGLERSGDSASRGGQPSGQSPGRGHRGNRAEPADSGARPE